jgi:hypothetical protein
MRHNVYSRGSVRVMKEKCETCIFRSSNRMSLMPGRVREMLAEVRRSDGCIPCHETLGLPEQAVCRGQFEVLKTAPLQIAERLGVIEETVLS